MQVISVALAAFAIASQDFTWIPYVMLSMGFWMLLAGFEGIQKNHKEFNGYMFVIFSLFLFIVSIRGFITDPY